MNFKWQPKISNQHGRRLDEKRASCKACSGPDAINFSLLAREEACQLGINSPKTNLAISSTELCQLPFSEGDVRCALSGGSAHAAMVPPPLRAPHTPFQRYSITGTTISDMVSSWSEPSLQILGNKKIASANPRKVYPVANRAIARALLCRPTLQDLSTRFCQTY